MAAELYLDRRLGVAKRLGIGIGNDEVDFMDSAGDHGIDGISAAAAHTDHLDYGTLVYGFIKFKHAFSPLRNGSIPNNRGKM